MVEIRRKIRGNIIVTPDEKLGEEIILLLYYFENFKLFLSFLAKSGTRRIREFSQSDHSVY